MVDCDDVELTHGDVTVLPDGSVAVSSPHSLRIDSMGSTFDARQAGR